MLWYSSVVLGSKFGGVNLGRVTVQHRNPQRLVWGGCIAVLDGLAKVGFGPEAMQRGAIRRLPLPRRSAWSP